MTDSVRTAITLGVLCLLVVIAAVWAWSATTEPLPAKVDRPACVDTEVAAGDRLYPQQVTVSVYNASSRDGLASRTMQALVDQGFPEGATGNAVRTRVAVAEIWTPEPDSPAVALLASYLGDDVEVERRDGLGPGVTVVVGDRFADLVEGKRFVAAGEDAVVCSPPVD